MRRAWLLLVVFAAACGAATPSSQDAGTPDLGSIVDSGAPDDAGLADRDAGSAEADAGLADSGLASSDAAAGPDADAALGLDAAPGLDAVPAAHAGWAKYTIASGEHVALVDQNGAARAPISGFTSTTARSFDFIFDRSAEYILTHPTQADDQLDWNKLPGLSDCGQVDLAQDGLMFAWRWRPDLVPPVLEIAHYANGGGTHLYPAAGLIALEEADLAAETPLHYELTITSTSYRFRISGAIGARVFEERAEFPRRCTGATPRLRWAGGFYFGGTSTAPHTIRGWIRE